MKGVQLLLVDLPPQLPGGHLELGVARSVDELEERHRRVVTLARAQVGETGAASRTVGEALAKRRPKDGQRHGRVGHGRLSLTEGPWAGALGVGDDLMETR